MAGIVVSLALLYPFSIGPAMRIDFAMSPGQWLPSPWFVAIYSPIGHLPRSYVMALNKYIELWLPAR
jgi:hypothetical protein